MKDLAYAPGPRHGMDVYLPARGQAAPPVMVFFYGGNWQYGDRGSYAFVGRSMAACGVMTIIPDYRVWPEVGYRGFLQDASSAVAAAREEARRRGGDLSRLFLMGHSAGAYIAAMLALDPEWLDHDTRTGLAGLIGLAGPYDFLPLHDAVLEQIFTPVGPATQPITYAGNAASPMLLLSGADDRTVDPANSMRLAARVRETGGRAETIVYPGISHVTLAGALAQPLRFLAPVRADVCRFIGLTPATSTAAAPSRGLVR